MKILVVSLMRLGDIVLAAPTIYGLRSKYPDAEIHLLINKQFIVLKPLLPFVDKFFEFDRQEIQEGLADSRRPLFEPFDRLDKFMKNLNKQEYDLLYNLTHTRLTGWLCSAIYAKEKVGLTLNKRDQPDFGSPWFKYLNNYVAAGGSEVFHYSDVFYFGCQLGSDPRFPELPETQKGRQELVHLNIPEGKNVAIQPFTSDLKKDWGDSQFVELIYKLKVLHPDYNIILLAAPFEEDRLKEMVQKCEQHGVSVVPAICSLEGAISILNRCTILVTGDTSIKHFACGTRAKIVELSLGSSDYRKTGAYKEGSVILQSKEACAPCSHASDCYRESQFCAERISSSLVASVVSQELKGDQRGLELVSREFSREVEIFRVVKCDAGYWLPIPIDESPSPWLVEKVVSRSAWKFFLDEEDKNSVGSYGSESLLLSTSLVKLYPRTTVDQWKSILRELESQTMKKREKIEYLQSSLSLAIKSFGDRENLDRLLDEVNSVGQEEDGENERLELVSRVARATEFTDLRKINCTLEDLEGRSSIKMKLIRSLLSNMEKPL